jgi:hypothetical protein
MSLRRGQSSVEPMLVITAIVLVGVALAMHDMPRFVAWLSDSVNWCADKLGIER